MRLDKDKITRHDAAAMRELDRVVKRCARIGASRVGALDFVDDISQELMLLILRRIEEYDPDREIEPFLIEAAKLTGKAMLRKHSREILIGECDEDERTSLRIESIKDESQLPAEEMLALADEEAVSTSELLLSRIAMEIAPALAEKGEGEEQQAGGNDNASQNPEATANHHQPQSRRKGRSFPDWDEIDVSPPPKVRRHRALSPRAKRFREIRKAICYSHKWMAVALGLELSDVHAIEYGSSEPSDEVLVKAEEMLRRMESEAPSLLNAHARNIAMDWMRRLGLRQDDYAGLAKIVGVDRSTAFRWLKGRYTPTPRKLWAIEMLVQQLEQERKEIARKMPRPT